MIHKKLSTLAATLLLIAVLLFVPVNSASAYTGADYIDAITKTADRLVALQSPTDFGWDWAITGLTSHTASPSATNLYGVTALGLLFAYQKTGSASYLAAAKKTADYMKYGDPSAGDFYNGHGSYHWGYSFDYKFLMLFSSVSGDMSYSDYALKAWAWEKANLARYADGNQAVLYDRYVDQWVGIGYYGLGTWGAADWGLATLEMGDTTWAQGMASVIHANMSNICIPMTGDYLTQNYTNDDVNLGMAWALKFLVTIGGYSSDVTSLRNQLLSNQLTDGSWDYESTTPPGATQTTAYVVMGLLAAGANTAARNGAEWLLANQLTNGGWYGSPTEYSEVDSEAMQALASFNVGMGSAALWVSPKNNDFCGPCVVSTNFPVDVNLFNKKDMSGYGVFAYDFYVEWANNTGTLSESMISLVGINVHVPWPTGSYFIVANETIKNVLGYSYYHLAITAIGNASLELTEFQGSLVTLTFHIDNEPCWPDVYTSTFHIVGNASLSNQCTQFVPVELDDGYYSLCSTQPNIELVPGPNEKGLNTESGASINETFIGNTHIVEVHLTNVTKAYGFSFVLTYDPFYWKIDYQHFSICATWPPPYETLMIDMNTPGTISFALMKPCEKPAVCGADVCAVSFSFVSTSPDIGKIPTPHTGYFKLTSASVFEKCPEMTEYSILNHGLLYGGDLPFYWGPCKTDITLDGKTDIADLSALAKKYDMTHPWGALAASGDMTKVDIYDFVQVAKHFGICPDP